MENSRVSSQFYAADRFKPGRFSLSVFTGCVSDLSLIEAPQHAYYEALKDYAERYADALAYLVADEDSVVHDDALINGAPSEPDHGLLGDDGEPVVFAQISDDDIDRCGYMGWLRH